MAHKKWVVRDADKERASALSEKFNIDPFVAFLMVSRGIVDDADAAFFVSKNVMLTSPYNLVDMEEASFIIGDAIDNGERICVYGDYDCDGVTATALLVDFLQKEGADVFYYIPSRENEGYGMNMDAIDTIKNSGAQLIITVDNGITAFDEAERIYELGMRLIITDHHQLSENGLPRAEAIVNPHREENDIDFRDYCGVGVAFKLACALYEGDADDLMREYADLVAIGTIADVMPLQNENRGFVRAGIEKINTNPRASVSAFVRINGDKQYTANDIAFQLCPRINAMGRMGDASRAVDFLLCEDGEKCLNMCQELNGENAERQGVEKQILDDVKEKINANPRLVSGRVIVIAGDGYHHGVIGIVASHILEKYGKPTIIIGIDDDGIARGSARSIDGFNIFDAISFCSDDLVQFGGHPLAAGVTLNADMIDKFRKDINDYSYQKFDTMPPQELVLDCKLSPFYLTTDLVDNLSVMEPYGASNPQVVFGIYKMSLVSVTPLSEGKHIRLELEKQGKRIRVVKFGTTQDEFPYKTGDVLNLAVRVSKNAFKGKMYLSIQAVDIRLASTDDDKYFAEKDKYEIYRSTGKCDMSIYPNRDVCAYIYKCLKMNGGYDYTLDDLYFRIQDKVTYGQLMIAIKAFSQAGLIDINERISLNLTNGRVNLEETKAISTLKGRLGID